MVPSQGREKLSAAEREKQGERRGEIEGDRKGGRQGETDFMPQRKPPGGFVFITHVMLHRDLASALSWVCCKLLLATDRQPSAMRD